MTHRIAAYTAGRDNNFNIIRMLAATGVLVSHAWPISLGPGTVQPLEHMLRGLTLGEVCVIIFFAVSGFFITKSFDGSSSLSRFVIARVLRLFPALVVVLGLTVLVAGLWLTTAPAGLFWSEAVVYMIRNLTLAKLQYALPGVFVDNPYGPPINGSLWTLFHEVLCYVCVTLAGMVGVLRMPRLFGVLFAGFVVLCCLAPLLPLPGRLQAFLGLALPFAIGTAFYMWRDVIALSYRLGVLLVVITCVVWWLPLLFRPVFVLTLSYWVFLIGMRRIPGLLAYNRFGDYSYGMYIYAFPLQQLAASWGVHDPLGNIAVALVMTLPCAVLSWHLVEKPALAHVPGQAARRGMGQGRA